VVEEPVVGLGPGVMVVGVVKKMKLGAITR
jgi:hypothetical protein